ncbi:MAG: endonuclease/exonuclease/phosphatase family protein [Verrucomicrobia bacterium]|nr:endonuclease/exonuclease/phosphatase family protein [Leptolyngbya sp. ES-bin-22]
MSTALKIATWNLQRPRAGSWKNIPKILEKIREINADVWVLTETNAAINPGDDYTSISSKFIPDYHTQGETCSTIWSRYPVKPLNFPTFDATVAVCAEITSPVGSFIVYGTIITWRDDGVQEGKAKAWERHYRAIEHQSADWLKLQTKGLPLCVAGDFNETLNEPFTYGSQQGRALLQAAFQANELVCVTAKESLGYNIDHICLQTDWAQKMLCVDTWDQHKCLNDDGKPVSDHNGVYVELSFA